MSGPGKTSLISLVVPAFNEAGNLSPLWAACKSVLDEFTYPWELIFVDDGSVDDTWATIVSLGEQDERVKGVRLSRNFGHQNALVAGLNAARGDAVITLDADLQHPQKFIAEMLEHWAAGSKIVKSKRIDPDDLPPLKRFTSNQFYKLFSYMSGVDLDSGMADFRLIDRQVLDEILSFREDGLFLRGLVEWVGYPASVVPYHSQKRLSGETKYTLRRMLKFAWSGISSFSLVPLRIGVFLGFFASALSFLAGIYAIVSKIITGSAVSGWSSTLAIISILFCILFIFLGLLGEYIGRVLIEVRQRPRFLVSERKGLNTE